jgi:hypothetical protein
MKRLGLLITVLFVFHLSTGFAQAPKVTRLVLAEEFTNASSGPSATQNPAFDSLLQANPTKITSVKYHTSFPGADSMNMNNPSEVSARAGFYGVSSVPSCRLNGSAPLGASYLGAPSNVNQAKIDAAYAVPAYWLIQFNQYIPPTHDSIYLTLLVKPTVADSGQLVAHIAVIEKHIHFDTAPGTNGETDFYNVMLKMLPNKSGSTLPSPMVVGDYALFQYSWPYSNVYDTAEVAAVAFVQDNANKFVKQAANSSVNPIVPLYANDVQIMSVTNVPVTLCVQSLTPTVTIRNNGSQPITELDIQYAVNSGTPSIFHWTGNLEFLQKADIDLPVINFNLAANNTIILQALNPNGIADEYDKNNTISADFKQAPSCIHKLSLMLKTDNSPLQTSWVVKNPGGQVIESSGVMSDPSTIYYTDMIIPSAGCYTFEIYDSGGDGICCSNGYGYFQLTDSTGTIAAEGSKFGSEQISAFYVTTNVGMEESSQDNNIVVYPNPVNDKLNVEMNLSAPGSVKIQIFNTLGSCVLSQDYFNMNTGNNRIGVPVADLIKGIYFIKIYTEESLYQAKFVK